MKKYLSLAFAFMLVLGMSFPALMADAYFEEDSKKENIIKTELSDTSLSDEAISFLAENNISLDSKVTPNSEVMSEGNGNTEYIGVLNEEILALKNAAQAYGFTQQQIQAYVEGILNTPTTVIFEEDNPDLSIMSNPTSTRVPDDGIGYEVQPLTGYSQATSYVTLPTRSINNLNDIAYLFYTAYSSSTCMDFGVRGGMYSWVTSFNPVKNPKEDGVAIGKNDGDRVYINISVASDGWLSCKIMDANNFSNVLCSVLYQMTGVKKDSMVFNKQISLCNNYATYTSGSSISHAKFNQSYLYNSKGYSLMNSSNTNSKRRGAFGGSRVTVNSYTQWDSEDVSIYFNS